MSRGLAGKVVDELDLINHPLFNPDLAEPKSKSLLGRINLRGFNRLRMISYVPSLIAAYIFVCRFNRYVLVRKTGAKTV
jgi:hypothetical protein